MTSISRLASKYMYTFLGSERDLVRTKTRTDQWKIKELPENVLTIKERGRLRASVSRKTIAFVSSKRYDGNNFQPI